MSEAPERDGRTPGGAPEAGTVAALIGVAAVSAAGLAFEISLTRVFAVAQFYHFAFLAVSLALLGFGASGSFLTAFPTVGRARPRRWATLAALQAVAIVAAYGVANTLPFDSFAIAWDRRQIVYLAVYYLALAVPFFFGGLVVAVLLTAGAHADPPIASHRVYAASLVGSGLGAVVALVSLDWAGAAASITLAAAIAIAGCLAFLWVAREARTAQLLATAALVVLVGMTVFGSDMLEMTLSPYKDLSAALRYPAARVVATDWEQGARVDLVVSEGIRSVPGLSLTYPGGPPRQDGVTLDADDLSPAPRVAADEAEFARHTLGAIAFQLRPSGRVLVLDPRGGLDLTIALANGAGSVVAVEPLRSPVAAIRATGTGPYDDPRVAVVAHEPRTFAERSSERFDVVDLALTAPYRPVASGAYSLAEDYRLTVEAFDRYFELLSPHGIFTATRWVQLPPSEETRMVATAVEALRRAGHDPARAVVVLRSYSNAVLLVQPDGFSISDLSVVYDFAETERFDIVVAPGPGTVDANRFNVVPDEEYSTLAAALVTASDPEPIYARHDFEISPPTDDRPFFGHYFKWSQAGVVLDTLGRTWQPFGGAGYFVLVALLGISAVAAIVLIAVPLVLRRRRGPTGTAQLRWWTLAYFALLGMAFLLVEIPLIQRFILLVGQPAAAFAVVLAAILVSSGIGSALSPRLGWRRSAVALAIAAAVYPFLVGWLTAPVLRAPYPVRLGVAAAMIAPLGFLMGVMFPRGLSYLESRAPALVPWAWAINGTVSVISAAAAAILMLGFGFSVVVQLGAIGYAAAALLARPARAVTPQPG